jgi:signal transduction histidine kinase
MRLLSVRIPRRHRRAILIYILTIVVPVGVLLWLGVESFERQREALTTLTAEKLTATIEARTREAADEAFRSPSHPIVAHFFAFAAGELVRPALRSPLPAPLPTAFAEADGLERSAPERALAIYRRLAGQPEYAALALSRVARTLNTLGRTADARATWRTLARDHADDRDPNGRPYGIVAALQAGDTTGLLEQIARPRWELPADQAEFFVAQLGGGAEPYLARFRFARELAATFRPPGGLRDGDLRSEIAGGRRLFYRADGAGHVVGFAADAAWLDTLAREVQDQLGIADPQAQDVRICATAIALVSLLLSAGVVLLVRDSARDARTSQLRSDFVSGVSHELKTPITLVRLYGETLLRHETLSTGERREFYRIITRESARLGRLVDQILSFARIERGELTYDLHEGDLASLVGVLVEDYREWLERAGFTLAAAVPASVPPVRFDAEAVSQALVNVLDNAAKYSGASKDIAVRLTDRGDDVVIDVEDHGVGIASSDQAKVFERFYRSRNGAGKGGYGLGLCMVRHIMQVHGGRVELDSEVGRGSRFRLVFPVVTS